MVKYQKRKAPKNTDGPGGAAYYQDRKRKDSFMDTHAQQNATPQVSQRREVQAHLERLNLYWWLYSLHNPQIDRRMDEFFTKLLEGRGAQENVHLFVATQQAEAELFAHRLQMATMPPESWYRSLAREELDREIGWFWDRFGVDLNLDEFYDPLNFRYIYPGRTSTSPSGLLRE